MCLALPLPLLVRCRRLEAVERITVVPRQTTQVSSCCRGSEPRTTVVRAPGITGAASVERRLRSFDLGGGEADAISVLQEIVGTARLPVDADQVVLGLAGGHFALKQCLNR